MTKSVTYKGKTIVYDTDDERAIRKRLVAGQSFDAFNEKERVILTEIARNESVRWNKSNAKRQEINRVVKEHKPVLEKIDALSPEQREKLDKILAGE